MRIGLFLDQWRDGGIPVFLDRLERQLTAAGHEVILILADPYPKREELPRKLYQALKLRLKERCVSLNFNSYPKFWKKSHFRHAILSQRLDCLLISQFYNYLYFLREINEELPLISISHTDSDYYYHEFLQTLEDQIFHIAVSREIERKCLSFASPEKAHKIHYIPYGVESGADFDPQPTGVLRIIYCARLDQLQKRCQDLVPLWRDYCERGGSGELTILGSGRGLEFLRENLAGSIATGRVSIKGHVSCEEALRVMARGDVLLNVSNFEGLPQTVLEGVSLGLFPLLSDIPSGHREIVETLKLGALCHLGDYRSFADELLRLEKNLSLIRSQRVANRAEALRHYSLSDCCDRYLEVFKKAAKTTQKAYIYRPYEPSFTERMQRAALCFKYRRHFGSLK